jgi:hypothetical protein
LRWSRIEALPPAKSTSHSTSLAVMVRPHAMHGWPVPMPAQTVSGFALGSSPATSFARIIALRSGAASSTFVAGEYSTNAARRQMH